MTTLDHMNAIIGAYNLKDLEIVEIVIRGLIEKAEYFCNLAISYDRRDQCSVALMLYRKRDRLIELAEKLMKEFEIAIDY